MSNIHYLRIGNEEYEQLARALVMYEHVQSRNADRKNLRTASSEGRESWPLERERFGMNLTEEERAEFTEDALKDLDAFVSGETWHELAWWIAERECARLGTKCRDKEARELVTDHIYHEVMEEFSEHGIERIVLPGVPRERLTLEGVAETLKNLRLQTRGLTPRGSSKARGK